MSNPNTLKDTSAPDAPGETVATTVRIKRSHKNKLETLPHGTSYHVRQALEAYFENLDKST